jgi:uncharacterized damage-inducible protein DinB
MNTDLRYPIGEFVPPADLAQSNLEEFFERIESAPKNLRNAVEDLSAAQLDTRYRPEGWTVRQVVHHLPDSHMNAYIRVKLALTEDAPTIRPYFEDRWAKLEDSHKGPIEPPLALFETLHTRWIPLLRNLTPDQLARTYTNPEYGETVSLRTMIATYAWHGDHHIAQIQALRDREGW